MRFSELRRSIEYLLCDDRTEFTGIIVTAVTKALAWYIALRCAVLPRWRRDLFTCYVEDLAQRKAEDENNT